MIIKIYKDSFYNIYITQLSEVVNKKVITIVLNAIYNTKNYIYNKPDQSNWKQVNNKQYLW